MAPHRYTHAIVCRIPNCFKTNVAELLGEIDLIEARKQHEELCKTLRELGVDVIELPPDESQPDCVFVEDTAIVCNGTALICRPGLPTRQKEVDIVRTIIKKELNLPIVDIANPEAMVDGGDILFTGREFFVGLSKRTNDAGARAVADAFPEYPVTPVKVPGKYHLKSLVSVAGPDILCVSASEEAQSVLKRMAQEVTYRYQTVTVPDSQAANCLYVNGTLIHRSEFPNSTKQSTRGLSISEGGCFCGGRFKGTGLNTHYTWGKPQKFLMIELTSIKFHWPCQNFQKLGEI